MEQGTFLLQMNMQARNKINENPYKNDETSNVINFFIDSSLKHIHRSSHSLSSISPTFTYILS